jgi:hypothetical protein
MHTEIWSENMREVTTEKSKAHDMLKWFLKKENEGT